ncbi:hypothetical protein JL720_15462 [Aureococcus anophagefferens]|nr:hypothetical protein JL720_15462 [Aureococcus anophagefferens]
MAAHFASPALGPDALKSAHSRLDKLKICGECQGLGMVKQTDGGKGALHIVRDVNCSKCRGEGMIFVGPPAEREAFYAEANRKPSTEGLAAAVSPKDEGDALAKSGDWAKAAAKYSEARGLDRCYLPALANRALCHLKLADFGNFAPAQHPPPRRAAPRRAVEPTLGVDFGLRRTGVCVGRGYASRPLEVVENCGNLTAHAAAIVALALREGATAFEQSGLSRAFAARLADVAALLVRDATSVVLWDERFSSREAEALLAYSPEMAGMLDAVAAAAILDDFFAAETPAEAVRASPAVVAGGQRAPPPAAHRSRRRGAAAASGSWYPTTTRPARRRKRGA